MGTIIRETMKGLFELASVQLISIQKSKFVIENIVFSTSELIFNSE